MAERAFTMKPKEFEKAYGRIVWNNEKEPTFVPNPLPENLNLSPRIQALNSKADRFIGELRGITRHLESINLFVNLFLTREAKLSSELEGTHTKLSEVFRTQAKITEFTKETTEVRNAIRSFEYGLNNENEEVNPMLREMHRRLFEDLPAKGEVGKFRKEQNFIGFSTRIEEAWYIPPLPNAVPELMDSFQSYYHHEEADDSETDKQLPPLIKAALLHYQFETIHPFIDGNGRIGRSIIPLYLIRNGIITRPIFFLSEYFRQFKSAYSGLLLETSKTGSFEKWLEFFLKGVMVQCEKTVKKSNQLIDLKNQYTQKLGELKASRRTVEIVNGLFQNPYVTIPAVERSFRTTAPTAIRDIQTLEKIGALREVTGKKRYKEYMATEIFGIISDYDQQEVG